MKHLPKEKRDRLILVVLGTAACLAAVWYGLVNNQRKSLDNIGKQIVDQRMKVTSAERLVGSAAEVKKSADVMEAKLKIIEDGMASGDMYSWIIQTMTKFCAGRGVDIPQFSREVTAEVGILPKFPYRAAIFTVRGSAHFHDLGKLVADFENAFPYTRLQNLEIDPMGNSAASPVANLKTPADAEKLSFKMEIVTLINPNNH
jgi:Tfp pilus assembly protein PilO